MLTLTAVSKTFFPGTVNERRALDAVGVDFILTESPPGGPGWRAFADRLGRAAVGSGGAEA